MEDERNEEIHIFAVSFSDTSWYDGAKVTASVYGTGIDVQMLGVSGREEEHMKLVIQRVNKASVAIDGAEYSSIGKGFLVLVGISDTDTKEIADKYIRKMVGLRIFEDEEGKTNLSLRDVGGAVLMVSQFTLYANCRKGNRPSFIGAGKPDAAEALYNYMVEKTKECVPEVKTGVFGAHMKVALENDGPFTILLDEHIL